MLKLRALPPGRLETVGFPDDLISGPRYAPMHTPRGEGPVRGSTEFGTSACPSVPGATALLASTATLGFENL